MEKKQRARRARGGYSLAEALVTLIILSLLTAAAAMGVTQALYQRRESIALADAQTVAATAAQVITDQLRYGQIAGVGSDGAVILSSGVYKMPIAMGLDGQSRGQLITQSVDSNGDTVDSSERALLGKDAYCGLELSKLKFDVKKNESGDTVNSVDVSLDVAKAGQTQSLWSLKFSVVPMDQRVFSI